MSGAIKLSSFYRLAGVSGFRLPSLLARILPGCCPDVTRTLPGFNRLADAKYWGNIQTGMKGKYQTDAALARN
ncbi:hypothetical protein [Pedobacter faecalis]|uniref:hypothetical protein n=1 Tax=Pedobacter faecalis TaxID=3041495 RepID=UPI00254A8A19|nr:hypothetical protein [Pedobacter sp. ELA7]